MNLKRLRSFLLVLCLCVPSASLAPAAVTPVGTIPIGDSPFALGLTGATQQAVVVNLFPTQTDNSNVRVLDLNNRVQLRAFKAGTRLVAVAISGSTALVVNEDQDVIRLIDVNSGTEVAQIPVGSRPSNIIAVPNSNTAIATNGTSSDLSFIDIAQRRVVGSPVTVGKDPRAVAINGRYAYVALGGDNAIGVVDTGVSPQRLLTTVPVGKNPVAVVVAANGQRALTANLTNNTLTALDISNPAAPTVIAQIPVGVQPTAMAVNPSNPNLVYVANLGSNFFSVVDISRLPDASAAVRGVVQMGYASSGIQVSSDATRLYVTEFKSQANLRIYDLLNMPLDPKPATDIPGEPRLAPYVTSTGNCGSSFYITEATLLPGQKEGSWGMEVLISNGLLTGGFNLGGGFEANGGSPGFGAFSIATAQTVQVSVTAQPVGQAALDVSIYKDNTTLVAGTSGVAPLTFTTASLEPGFYAVRIRSLPGSPRGTFQLSLGATAFSGGVVVGGFISEGVTGFGAFCVPRSQNVDMKLIGNSQYGSAAAGDLVLTLRDGARNVVRTLNNSISPSAPVTPPAAPSISGLNISWYVDASVVTSGSGTSTSPFKSITQAITAARSGDVIFVRAGRYSPSRTQEQIPIGSAGPGTNGFATNVTLIRAGAATTIIDGENITRTADNNGNVIVIPASGVRFAGFTVRGAAQVGTYVFNASNVTVENNLFTSNTRFGVGAQGSSGLIIRNNVAVSNLESGIALSGSIGTALSNAPTNCPASPAGNFGAYIVNNTSQDNRADGILLSAGGNYCIANNITNNNGSSGIEFNNRAEGVTVPALNGVIVNNQLAGNGGVQFGFAGTGILVTENNAKADLIQGNVLEGNRPFGIGIFLNGKAGRITQNTLTDTQHQGILVQKQSTADEISSNTIRNSGLSGLFIENGGTVTAVRSNVSTGNGTGISILNGSAVTTLDSNTVNDNGVGMEIAAGEPSLPGSQATTVTNNTFDSNATLGVLVRQASRVTSFGSNKVRNNRGPGLLVSASTITVSNAEITGNASTGLGVSLNSTATISSSVVSNNGAEGGLYADGGSRATVTGTTISANVKQGAVAGDAGTVITLAGANSVTGNLGIGLNAQSGATISCTGTNTVSGNTGDNTLGNVINCGQ